MESYSLRTVDFHSSFFKANAVPVTELNGEPPRWNSSVNVNKFDCQLLASHKGFSCPPSIIPGLSSEKCPAWGQDSEDRRLLGAKSLDNRQELLNPCMKPEPLLREWDWLVSPCISVQWAAVWSFLVAVSTLWSHVEFLGVTVFADISFPEVHFL